MCNRRSKNVRINLIKDPVEVSTILKIRKVVKNIEKGFMNNFNFFSKSYIEINK